MPPRFILPLFVALGPMATLSLAQEPTPNPVPSTATTVDIPAAVAATPTPTPVPVTPLNPPAPPSVDGPLTLEQAIAISFSNHGDVLSAREQLKAANERITSAKSNRAPQLSGTIGTNYQNTHVTTSTFGGVGGIGGTSTTVTTSTLTTGVALSQNIFDSGRTKYSVRQSRGQAGSALSSVGLTKNSLAFEVATRFYDQLRSEQLVAQRTKQLEIANNQLAQTEAQITAGTSARSDIFDARVPVSQAKFDLVSAQNDLRLAVTNFRGALGLGRGEKISIVNETGLDDPTDETTLEKALETALSRRPDVLSDRLAIFTARSAVKASQIEARPNVSASLGYNIDPRSTGDRGLQVGATLSLPLFNGGGRRADVRAAQDELRAAELRLIQTQRDVQVDVETAWTQITGQEERVRNAQALVDSAQNALDTAQARYQEGKGVGIALDVSVAQSRLFEAQVTLIGAQFDLRLSRLDLRRATGDFAWEDGQVPASILEIAPEK